MNVCDRFSVRTDTTFARTNIVMVTRGGKSMMVVIINMLMMMMMSLLIMILTDDDDDVRVNVHVGPNRMEQ